MFDISSYTDWFKELIQFMQPSKSFLCAIASFVFLLLAYVVGGELWIMLRGKKYKAKIISFWIEDYPTEVMPLVEIPYGSITRVCCVPVRWIDIREYNIGDYIDVIYMLSKKRIFVRACWAKKLTPDRPTDLILGLLAVLSFFILLILI